MGFCPCCFGCPLQVGCKIISIIDMIGAIFGGLTGLLLLLSLIFYRDELLIELLKDARIGKNYELRNFMEKPIGVQYSFIIFTIIICSLELIVAFILLKGARKRNVVKCTLWFRIHCVLLLLGILFTILAIVSSREKILICIVGISGLIYQAYALWVVKAFIQELNAGGIILRKNLRLRSSHLDHHGHGGDDDEEQAEPLQEMFFAELAKSGKQEAAATEES